MQVTTLDLSGFKNLKGLNHANLTAICIRFLYFTASGLGYNGGYKTLGEYRYKPAGLHTVLKSCTPLRITRS
jgi:hypothetical protein